ncbi:MAG TPA: O-antigen ligase family protein [Terracidiphilus sp.]
MIVNQGAGTLQPPASEGLKLHRGRSFSSRIASTILYAALAGPPLLFGSSDVAIIAIWCALLGVGLIFASTRRLQAGHVLILAGVGFVGLCFGLVLHEQLSVRPWVAPFNPIWAKVSGVLSRPLLPSASIVRGEPAFALGRPLANVLALVLGLVIGVNTDRARYALSVMAWSGVAYAIYGMVMLALDPTMILWREKTAYIGSLTATFINRNTAGAYFGSCSAVWLILLMNAIRRTLPRGAIEWREVMPLLLRERQKEVLVRLVMLFICLSGMFLTNSRGGVLVSLGAMVVSFLVYFVRDMPRGPRLAAAVLGSVGTALFLLESFGSGVTSRIDLQGLSDAGRLSAYQSTLRIIADNAWFGTGLGTFAYSFPAYRSGDLSMQGIWNLAHSTPLELASEMGVPLAIVVAVAWIAALVILWFGSRGQRRLRVVPLSALTVSLIALLHSCIDFSLQIAGYSIVVFALLGLGLSQAVLGRRGRADVLGSASPREPVSIPDRLA